MRGGVEWRVGGVGEESGGCGDEESRGRAGCGGVWCGGGGELENTEMNGDMKGAEGGMSGVVGAVGLGD